MGGDPAENGDPTYLSIYAHKDARFCAIPLILEAESLDFYIQGKRIQSDADEGEFQTLSIITLPFDEILTALKYKQLGSEIIPSCFLELSYVDELPEAPFKDQNILEIK